MAEPTPTTLPQTSVDSNTVINLLRQQIADLQWDNVLLNARLIQAEQISAQVPDSGENGSGG